MLLAYDDEMKILLKIFPPVRLAMKPQFGWILYYQCVSKYLAPYLINLEASISIGCSSFSVTPIIRNTGKI
jgi:hypothetical protein